MMKYYVGRRLKSFEQIVVQQGKVARQLVGRARTPNYPSDKRLWGGSLSDAKWAARVVLADILGSDCVPDELCEVLARCAFVPEQRDAWIIASGDLEIWMDLVTVILTREDAMTESFLEGVRAGPREEVSER